MKQLHFLILALCTLCASPVPVSADEGMWMLNELSPQTAKQMQALGLKLTPEQLYKPGSPSLKDAVVLFGGYCSGVIVSKEGLVLTNHHCGLGSVQSLSDTRNDYVANGFVAHTAPEEKPVPGLYVSILQRTENVTNRILPFLKREMPREKKRTLIDSVELSIVNEVIKGDSSLRAEITPYYMGNEFYLNIYRDFTDIRLVFAPPMSAGKFGGDTDNWVWPRETCDFSVFRIYADENNRPAAYNTANRPYRPEVVAPISLQGYQKGDYAMVLGFPGSTSRYLTSEGVLDRMLSFNEAEIDVAGVQLYVCKKAMDADPNVRLKYVSKYASNSNFWKNCIGMNRCLTQQDIVRRKQLFEKEITDWIKSNPLLTVTYDTILPTLNRTYREYREARRTWFKYLFSLRSDIGVFKIAEALKYSDFSRKNPKQSDELRRLSMIFRDVDIPTDKRIFAVTLWNYAVNEKPENLPDFYRVIREDFDNNYSAYVDYLYSQSVLSDSARILSLASKGKVGRLRKDVLVQFYEQMLHKADILRSSIGSSSFSGLEKKLTEAIRLQNGERPFYSDANMTLRLSYGLIRDYNSPSGDPYPLFTTPERLAEKVRMSGKNKDYFMEPSLVKLLTEGDYGRYTDKNSGTLQLCFLTDNDITGGNSGSPLFNGKGELLGLAFDGNWDAMANDLMFTSELTRTINVDIRYILFMIEKWGKAERLIKEMDLME